MAPPPAHDPTVKTGPGNVFTRKVGPLPGWAWVAIAAAGIFVVMRMRANSTAAASTVGTTANGQSDASDSDAYDADTMSQLMDSLGTSSYDAVSPGNGGTSAAVGAQGATGATGATGAPGAPAPTKAGTVTSPGKVAKPVSSIFGTGTNYSLETLIGSGYNADNKGGFVGAATGRDFSAVQPNSAQVASMVTAGDLYYQSARGVATKVTKANDAKLKKGTPFFTIKAK